MEMLQIIDELEDVIEKSFSVFGYAFAKKEEVLSMVDEIRLKLPEEIKQAKWVKEERQHIIDDAKKEADRLIKEAQDTVISMIDEHEITKAAKEKANEILTDAHNKETEMQHNAIFYADTLLEKLDKTTSAVLDEIKESRRQLGR
jgi:cell division septum initiation protein DivIVA